MRIAAILLALAALAACEKAPTIIDGRNPEAFAKTTEAARRDLDINERLTFDAAMKAAPGQRFSAKDPDKQIREAYHGMTAKDVIADARARGIQ